jgi:hypothetical protein
MYVSYYEVIGIMVVVIIFLRCIDWTIVFDEQLSAINLSKHVFPYVRFYLFPYTVDGRSTIPISPTLIHSGAVNDPPHFGWTYVSFHTFRYTCY